MMPLEYIVSSLPQLSFSAPSPISWEAFRQACGENLDENAFKDTEIQLRNAIAEARTGDGSFARECKGCSVYWKNRILACFQEKDVLKRDEAIDKVWWDAAGELTNPSAPLGKGALATYAIRLKILLKRDRISTEAGMGAFDRLAEKAQERA